MAGPIPLRLLMRTLGRRNYLRGNHREVVPDNRDEILLHTID
jgi:hypothetical protein